MTKDEALHKALKVLNCLNNDRVYETAWVKGAINACEEALEPQIELADTISVEDYQKLREQPTNMVTIGSEMTKLINEEEYLKWEEEKHKEANLRWEEAQRREPTQEPVAYFKKWEDKSGEHKDIKFSNSEGYKPLYTHPAPSWQELSDDEIWDIANFLGKNKEWDYPVMFAKTIEKALKEKNNV